MPKRDKIILKWAGGKSWLIKKIIDSLAKENFNNYLEPFLGGGSFFYFLQKRFCENKNMKRGYLSDINPQLIKFYRELKTNPLALFNETEKLVKEHERKRSENTHKKIYKKYKNEFIKSPSATLFLYLNKLCFNGIYREGPKGFNVPIGRPISKWDYTKEDFLEWQNFLKGFNLQACDFQETLGKANDNDLIYLDPPYVDRKGSKSKTFRKYSKEGFSESNLEKMSELANELNPKCKILISNFNENHATKFFKKSDGWIKIPLMKKYSISGNAKGVSKFKEILISNFEVNFTSN